jgi:hypothetical protein
VRDRERGCWEGWVGRWRDRERMLGGVGRSMGSEGMTAQIDHCFFPITVVDRSATVRMNFITH